MRPSDLIGRVIHLKRQRAAYAARMEKLHRESADKLAKDVAHLSHALESGQVELALSIAKRVRRTSTMLVKALAAERDDNEL